MADEDGHTGYNNTHRAFLQALLSRQTITYDEAKPILSLIETAANPDRPTLPEDVSPSDFETYIHILNEQISQFDMEIRSTTHQISKQVVYALVNTRSDTLTQMATLHTPDEIAFVKRVLDAMFETYNTPRAEVMAVTSMQALKLAKAPADANRRESGGAQQSQAAAAAGLTLAQAEKTLANLVSEGWLELSNRGFYSLTPRALMELRGWLLDAYNDQEDDSDEEEEQDVHEKIKFCQACKEIVTVGQRCPKMECQARLHDGCVRNMFRAQGGNEQCPLCKTAWVDAGPVGEKAARSAQRPSVNGTAARRRRNETAPAAEENDSSETEDGEDA